MCERERESEKERESVICERDEEANPRGGSFHHHPKRTLPGEGLAKGFDTEVRTGPGTNRAAEKGQKKTTHCCCL